ncbi:hypothetical protein DRP07_10790, partial [Archaeoglobales archaeon]
IKDLAEELNNAAEEILGKSPGIEFIPNPRKEKEEAEYKFDNSKFMKVLGKPKHEKMAETLNDVVGRLSEYSEVINSYKDAFIKK